MVYPNITDEETRKQLARTLLRWHRDLVGEKIACRNRVKEDPFLQLSYHTQAYHQASIYGFRRALEIINDEMKK